MSEQSAFEDLIQEIVMTGIFAVMTFGLVKYTGDPNHILWFYGGWCFGAYIRYRSRRS